MYLCTTFVPGRTLVACHRPESYPLGLSGSRDTDDPTTGATTVMKLCSSKLGSKQSHPREILGFESIPRIRGRCKLRSGNNRWFDVLLDNCDGN